ncbi:MAG: penicillin-binding protein [Paucimonas sp.]|nr:penicillin-binding protein [Paucimonas sp.]
MFRLLTSRGFRLAGGASLILIACVLLAAYLAVRSIDVPDIGDIRQARNQEPSVMLASDGSKLATFRQIQQKWVSLDEMSPYIVKALIATEDHRFYEHHGIDYSRTVSAVFHTARGEVQGGSTITQQLARNLFPQKIGRSRTVTRKVREMLTAKEIEKRYTKDEILETYLNTVPFLYNVTGIEMAARTYYGKSAADLNLLQSAMLVGMLKGTHYYNPVVNPDRAIKRRNVVLAQMAKRGLMQAPQAAQLSRKPLELKFARQVETQDPTTAHFVVYARKWLAEWSERNGVNLFGDGLVIQTTIEPKLQKAAVQAVKEQTALLQRIADVEWGRSSAKLLGNSPDAYARLHKRVEPFRYFWDAHPKMVDTFLRESPAYKKAVAGGATPAAALARLRKDDAFMAQLREAKTRLEAGFVAMDPTTGEVKAWVGSRDFNRDQFDHVAQALRQPGSTFKPIVYGAALEQGLSPHHLYRDVPVEIKSRDAIWRPTDMTGWSGREMSLRQGLVYSKNTITAQVMQDVGLPAIVDLAKAVGINQSRLDPVPSLALGTSSVTLLEMVSAYSTIAQMGEYNKPVFIKRITDRHGNVVAEFGGDSERVLSLLGAGRS